MQGITKRIKLFRHGKRGISNVIVIMLSLILIVVIVSNVVLWSYQMNQFDWERTQEDISITDVTAVGNVWSNYPYGYSLWGSTSWLSGDVSELTADDSNHVTFSSYYSGTDTQVSVDSISDVDSHEDVGTHSNFSAQQTGPDSIFDALDEQNNRIFEQITVSSQQTTTNTAWTDVVGAAITFTPRSSTEEWLVLVTADIRSSSTSEDRARFRYTINGVSRGATGVQQGTTSTAPIDPYNTYFHFSRITNVASQQTVRFQFQASSGATAYARNVHVLCIRLDSAGLRYAEVNGDISITGSQTLATLQFTPSSPGDYVVAYCVLVSELPNAAGSGAETWLDRDFGTGLYPVAWTTPNVRRIHTDRDQFEPHGLFTRINLNTTQHTFGVQAQLRTAGATCTARDMRIAAFRVDAFDLLEYDEDSAISRTNATNTVRSIVNAANPGEQRDYLILSGIHTISSGTSSRESGGVEIDDVFVQRKGDRRLDYTDIARIASHYAFVITRSTSFKVETTFGTGGAGTDTIYSKQSAIYVLKIPKNYNLDLEVHWTNVTYNLQNEELCLNAVSAGSEDLRVDVWNGSAWQSIFTNISNGWNNVSISSYLMSSTFTIRFNDANQTDDTIRDNWDIDIVLLHVWSHEHTAEVEFAGLSNTEAWKQFNWTTDSSWTIGSVNVTLQLYNYTLNDYSTGGNGHIAYVSSDAQNTDEKKNQTITSNPAHFRNATGNWKIKVRGVKATDISFDLRVDLVEYKIAETPLTRFTFQNKGSQTSHLVSLWIIDSEAHKRYTINVFVNSGETWTYSTSQISLPDGQYIVKITTERGNMAVYTDT